MASGVLRVDVSALFSIHCFLMILAIALHNLGPKYIHRPEGLFMRLVVINKGHSSIHLGSSQCAATMNGMLTTNITHRQILIFLMMLFCLQDLHQHPLCHEPLVQLPRLPLHSYIVKL